MGKPWILIGLVWPAGADCVQSMTVQIIPGREQGIRIFSAQGI
ncbi:hypothetical protein [Pasteuria penetrans]|nr:hypothetical protein [Pasteuria penetrans]